MANPFRPYGIAYCRALLGARRTRAEGGEHRARPLSTRSHRGCAPSGLARLRALCSLPVRGSTAGCTEATAPPCLPSPVSPSACGLRWGTQAAPPHQYPRARFTTRAPLGLRRGSAALALLLGLLVGLRHLPPRARHQPSSNKASRVGPFQDPFRYTPNTCYRVALASRSCPEAGLQGNLAHEKQRPPRTFQWDYA